MFDTIASRTYVNEETAGKIGYLRFPTMKEVLTAATDKNLNVTGILDFGRDGSLSPLRHAHNPDERLENTLGFGHTPR